MADLRYQRVNKPRGGSIQWQGVGAGPTLLRAEFFGAAPPPAGPLEIIVTPATYSLTGASAITLWRRRAQITPGSYAITGQSAQTRWGRAVDTTAAAYAITGSPGELIYVPLVPALTLDVTPGAYVITGSSAGVQWRQRLDVTPAAFTVAGQTVTVRRTYRADVSPGAYTVAGVVATLEYSGELPPEVTVEYQTTMRRRRRER